MTFIRERQKRSNKWTIRISIETQRGEQQRCQSEEKLILRSQIELCLHDYNEYEQMDIGDS